MDGFRDCRELPEISQQDRFPKMHSMFGSIQDTCVTVRAHFLR